MVTDLSIRGEGENSRISTNRFTEKTGYDQIQDPWRGSHSVADVAQAAIQEPGAFAFYYPNNDVLNGGRPTPAAGLDPKMPLLFGSNPYAAMENSTDGASCAGRYRSYDPASGTFLGYDGRRHARE